MEDIPELDQFIRDHQFMLAPISEEDLTKNIKECLNIHTEGGLTKAEKYRLQDELIWPSLPRIENFW